MLWFIAAPGFLFAGIFLIVAIQEALNCYRYRESNVETTTGFLTETKHSGNVTRTVGHNETRVFRHWTTCVYTYTVKGVTNQIEQGIAVSPKRAKRTVHIVYQRNNVQRAYVREYAQPFHPGLIAVYSIPAAAFFVLGLVMIFSIS